MDRFGVAQILFNLVFLANIVYLHRRLVAAAPGWMAGARGRHAPSEKRAAGESFRSTPTAGAEGTAVRTEAGTVASFDEGAAAWAMESASDKTEAARLAADSVPLPSNDLVEASVATPSTRKRRWFGRAVKTVIESPAAAAGVPSAEKPWRVRRAERRRFTNGSFLTLGLAGLSPDLAGSTPGIEGLTLERAGEQAAASQAGEQDAQTTAAPDSTRASGRSGVEAAAPGGPTGIDKAPVAGNARRRDGLVGSAAAGQGSRSAGLEELIAAAERAESAAAFQSSARTLGTQRAPIAPPADESLLHRVESQRPQSENVRQSSGSERADRHRDSSRPTRGAGEGQETSRQRAAEELRANIRRLQSRVGTGPLARLEGPAEGAL